ncbi:hypothetical protein HZS_819 [Henneguya salminicola]|nr:hypothetical protein HZS_819 [Henneguya salminicola]
MRLRESTKAKRDASPIQTSYTKITKKVGESKRSKSLTPEDCFKELTKLSENSQSTQQKKLFYTNLRKAFEIVCELEIDTKCNIFPKHVPAVVKIGKQSLFLKQKKLTPILSMVLDPFELPLSAAYRRPCYLSNSRRLSIKLSPTPCCKRLITPLVKIFLSLYKTCFQRQ